MRFVVISDTHLSTMKDAKPFRWWHRNLVPQAREICALAVQQINRMNVDFVVHCGDITNSSDGPSMELAARVFGDLDCPFYFVPGNHDCWEKGARARTSGLFDLAGGDILYRRVELDEAILLLLDGVYWESTEGEYRDYLDFQDLDRAMEVSGHTGLSGGLCLPEEQVAWVEDILRRRRDKTILVFLHAGLDSRGTYETSKDQEGKLLELPPARFPSGYRNSGRLLEILGEHSAVKAVFSGHNHWNECYARGGLLHCCTGALIQYPCEMRLIELSRDCVSGSMVPLDDPAFAERSFDEESDGAFVVGRPADREFDYRITGGAT